jgi:hypothetical protein
MAVHVKEDMIGRTSSPHSSMTGLHPPRREEEDHPGDPTARAADESGRQDKGRRLQLGRRSRSRPPPRRTKGHRFRLPAANLSGFGPARAASCGG